MTQPLDKLRAAAYENVKHEHMSLPVGKYVRALEAVITALRQERDDWHWKYTDLQLAVADTENERLRTALSKWPDGVFEEFTTAAERDELRSLLTEIAACLNWKRLDVGTREVQAIEVRIPVDLWDRIQALDKNSAKD